MATVRKLVVEVVEARNLLPKDGTGTSSPYARADFDGQRRKTRTVPRDLNPAWSEPLEFNFSGPGSGGVDPFAGEPLEIAVFHDVRMGPSRRNNFLGRVRLDARQFVRKGEEALIYFPLEKKSFFCRVRGDIGLKVYYLDEPLAPPEPEPTTNDPPAAEAEAAKDVPAPADPPPVQTEEPSPPAEVPAAEAGGAPQGAGDEASTEKPPEAGTAAPTPATEDAPVMSSEAVPAADGAASES
ncbi:protein QUIRKY-like [Lolium rigidum]|uniref:protein QUIRKY-like n=1 Tax=Lolium rigidum TaxID=89674 RepID=UPI001F5CB4DC|nr:protein QUIRKY-like [Lolium rigidum]